MKVQYRTFIYIHWQTFGEELCTIHIHILWFSQKRKSILKCNLRAFQWLRWKYANYNHERKNNKGTILTVQPSANSLACFLHSYTKKHSLNNFSKKYSKEQKVWKVTYRKDLSLSAAAAASQWTLYFTASISANENQQRNCFMPPKHLPPPLLGGSVEACLMACKSECWIFCKNTRA